MKDVTDLDAERIAHAVSNSDDLRLPQNPDRVLRDMLKTVPQPRINVSGYHPVSVRGRPGTSFKRGSPSRLKAERNQAVLKFVAAGNSAKEAAAFFEISASQVSLIIRRGY